jgi:cyanophycinase-like exopeptidase
MDGVVAMVGSGEFTPAMDSVDRALLEASGRPRPRAVVLSVVRGRGRRARATPPVAAARAHLEALGAEVEALLLRRSADGDDAAHVQAVTEADIIYIADAPPDLLYRALASTALERALRRAHERGGVIAGCSGGATVLGQHRPRRRRRLGIPGRWGSGLGMVPRVAVMTRYDAIPLPLRALAIARAPRGSVVLGIDRATALVGRGGSWQVHGPGRVTVWRGRRRSRHAEGDVLRL